MTTRVPGYVGAVTTSASGAFDNRSHRGRMTVDMTDLRREAAAGLSGAEKRQAEKRLGPPDDWRGEEIVDLTHGRLIAYMRVPFFSRVIRSSKPWIKYDFQRLGEQAGIDFGQLTQLGGGNPAAAIDYLRAVSGKVETKGHEDVRGVETTHYHVTIDFEKYPNLVPSERRPAMRKTIDRLIELTGTKTVPSDVWIGDDQLVRKMRYAYTMRLLDQNTGRRQPRELDFTMELYDFGATVDAAIPPDSQVFDLAAVLDESH